MFFVLTHVFYPRDLARKQEKKINETFYEAIYFLCNLIDTGFKAEIIKVMISTLK